MVVYTTPRGNPLVYHGEVTNTPVLAVENYCKWYSLWVIHLGDDELEPIDFDLLEEVVGASETAYVDHVPNPRAVVALAERRGWTLCDQSRELIYGRWQLEVVEYGNHDNLPGRVYVIRNYLQEEIRKLEGRLGRVHCCQCLSVLVGNPNRGVCVCTPRHETLRLTREKEILERRLKEQG